MSENSDKLGDLQGTRQVAEVCPDEDLRVPIENSTAEEWEVALLLDHIYMQGDTAPKFDRRVYGGKALSKEIDEVRKGLFK